MSIPRDEMQTLLDDSLRKRGYVPEKTPHENYMRSCFSAMYKRIYLQGWNDCLESTQEGEK